MRLLVGVLFNYVGFAFCNVLVPNGCVDPSNGVLNTGAAKLSQGKVQVTTVTQDIAGAQGIAGVLVASIDLATQASTATTSIILPRWSSLGSFRFRLITPIWDGSITTHEQECSGTPRGPGSFLNLINVRCRPQSSMAKCQIQRGARVTLRRHHRRNARNPWTSAASELRRVDTNGEAPTACHHGILPRPQIPPKLERHHRAKMA